MTWSPERPAPEMPDRGLDIPQFRSAAQEAPSTNRGPGERLTSERTLELAATLLLALASVATAWSAYQARQWTGVQASQTGRATAVRISVNRNSALAGRSLQIDVATFIQWVNTHQEHQPALAAFYAARFRRELKRGFAAWLAKHPFANEAAPKTPFAMRQYRLAASKRADQLEVTAAADSEAATNANQTADDYMLAVVLFASVLFFAGISTKLAIPSVRVSLIALGCVMLVGRSFGSPSCPSS